MTIKLITLLSFLLVAAVPVVNAQPGPLPTTNTCWKQTAALYDRNSLPLSSALNSEIEAYKRLVEEALVHRETAIQVMKRLQDEGKVDGREPLTGYDLDLLNLGLVEHLSLRDELYLVAYRHSCWHRPEKGIYRKLNMEPLSVQNQLKGVMLSLSAALILYDNYLLMSSLYEENSKLRRYLNQKDPAYDKGRNALYELARSYASINKRAAVRQAIRYYEKQLKQAPPELFEDADIAYLDILIRQSHSYNMMKKSSPLFSYIGRRISFMSAVTTDDIALLKKDGMNLFSGLFGNLMGLVESRRGKLYNDPAVLRHVEQGLKAGDILLEKTPFRLTDKLIPGHWGHVAIWVGSESELKALGIWDDPAVIPHHDKIRSGAAVVEALRSGVQMNSIDHFLNVDDLAILRAVNSSKGANAKRIILALKQVGKAYDFNFDIETTDRIVCSELVYTVYTGMEWPTQKTLGRYTISPDHVAKKTIDEDGGLKLIMLYHDGDEVVTGRLERMAQLMGEAVTSLQSRRRHQDLRSTSLHAAQ